jgi:hypothetical protein
MKKGIILFIFTICYIVVWGQNKESIELIKDEIYKTEKAFDQMVAEKGIAEAFYRYTDSLEVINRGNVLLIYGNDNICHFYACKNNPNVMVSWTHDFIACTVIVKSMFIEKIREIINPAETKVD